MDKISLIAKRDFERKLDLQKRKDDKCSLAAESEKLAFFQTTFNNTKSHIENLMEQSPAIDKSELPTHLNEVSKEILLLQKYVANSNIFLRTYDIKKCHETVQELTNKLKSLEEQLLPKKKFGFKNKSKAKKQQECGDEVDFQRPQIKEVCGYVNKNGETLLLTGDEIYKKDVNVENLENCKIKILGCPSTLHLNYLKNCQVFTGPVSTSIFAENCTDCTLVIACQQLRLHSSTNVHIYLHVTSRAIMEDCSQIFLAPYNFHYDTIQKDFQEAGLDKEKNNWTCVDDFNWLNVEKQSPNWALLDEKNIQSWDD